MNIPDPIFYLQGKPRDGDTTDEAAHFMKCPACSQVFDRRVLGQALYHGMPHTDPMPPRLLKNLDA